MLFEQSLNNSYCEQTDDQTDLFIPSFDDFMQDLRLKFLEIISKMSSRFESPYFQE